MTQEEKFNQVDHPDYYRNGNTECIEAMELEFGAYEVAIFSKLSAFKYLYRKGDKGPADTDIRKAQWYVDRHNQKREPNFQEEISIGSLEDLVSKYK